MKEAIHIRLNHNHNNVNKDNGAEIPQASMPTIKIMKASRVRQVSGHIRKTPYREAIAQSKCGNHSRPPPYIMLYQT